jgi:hypothetical protein
VLSSGKIVADLIGRADGSAVATKSVMPPAAQGASRRKRAVR